MKFNYVGWLLGRNRSPDKKVESNFQYEDFDECTDDYDVNNDNRFKNNSTVNKNGYSRKR